ncbi:MAG: hypothetical protein ACU0CA_08660 [Paracoccaceae bacterium]
MKNIFFFVLLIFSHPSFAQERADAHTNFHSKHPIATTVKGDFSYDCPIKKTETPTWWTSSEIWAWERICQGEIADMSHAISGTDDGAGCDAKNTDDKWPETRKLSARFIESIAKDIKYSQAANRNSIKIHCAEIAGRINLENEEVVPSLWLDFSRIPGGVNFESTKFNQALTFDHSLISPGNLNGIGAQIRKHFGLRNGQYSEVNIRNINVGLDIDATEGSQFSGDIDLSAVNIGGSVIFSDIKSAVSLSANWAVIGKNLYIADSNFKNLNIRFASIASQLRIINSTISENIYADGLKVRGDVSIDNVDADQLIFVRARLGNDLNVADTNIRFFNSASAVIDGDVSLGGSMFEFFSFWDASVGGSFATLDAEFTGVLDLSRATIKNDLVLSLELEDISFPQLDAELQSVFPMLPIWRSGAFLSLDNTHVGKLNAAMPESWSLTDNTADRSGYLRYDLSGFKYDRLDLSKALTSDVGDGTKALIDWLNASQIGDCDKCKTAFEPQKFVQLSQILRESGAISASKAVSYAGHMHKLEHSNIIWRRGLGQILRWVVGFGVYPERAFFWFIGLLALGILFGHSSRGLSDRRIDEKFWYSLDNTLPFIELSRDHAEINHESRLVENFFQLQKVLGFVVATILVAALTLLSG